MQNGRGKSEYSTWTPEDLSKMRTESGFSRTDMAKKLGVSYRMYCYYETGHTKIDLPMEYAVRWLCSGEEKPKGTLTAFQKERIDRLLDGIRSYPIGDLDERGQKILQQSVNEISLMMEHLS